jgi:hypothetical protein
MNITQSAEPEAAGFSFDRDTKDLRDFLGASWANFQ